MAIHFEAEVLSVRSLQGTDDSRSIASAGHVRCPSRDPTTSMELNSITTHHWRLYVHAGVKLGEIKSHDIQWCITSASWVGIFSTSPSTTGHTPEKGAFPLRACASTT
jgi:hypothetical protein